MGTIVHRARKRLTRCTRCSHGGELIGPVHVLLFTLLAGDRGPGLPVWSDAYRPRLDDRRRADIPLVTTVRADNCAHLISDPLAPVQRLIEAFVRVILRSVYTIGQGRVLSSPPDRLAHQGLVRNRAVIARGDLAKHKHSKSPVKTIGMSASGTGGDDDSVAEYMSLVGKRTGFLEHLCEHPAKKRDLIDELGVSRSTVDRALDDLQDAGLVRYTDGVYETTAAGVLAVKHYRSYIDQATDITAAHEALQPLPPDTRLDPAMVVGASVNLAEGPRPYQALQPLETALGNATRIRALLPNVADSRYIDLYRSRATMGADVELVLSSQLSDTLKTQFPSVCKEMAEAASFSVSEAAVPPFGVVLADDGGVTTVSVVVYTEAGSVHAVTHAGTLDAVRWAESLFEEVAEEATGVTESFRDVDVPSGTCSASQAHDTVMDTSADSSPDDLSVDLEAEGFTRLSREYFAQREPRDPATCWRTGLRLVDVAAGYAVDRTRGDADDRTNITESVTARLRDGTDTAILGPLGAGKSTVCKAVAWEWYRDEVGPVFYRESGQMDSFESVARLRTVLEEQAGHALVVVEDAVRAEANAALTLGQQFDGNSDVTFLFDARESEWQNPDALPIDARLDSYRTDGIETVRLPSLDEQECRRFVNHFERTTGRDVPATADELLNEIRRETPDGETRRGEVLLLFYRLARYAQTTADADDSAPTALIEDVQRTYRDRSKAAPLSIEVAVMINLLNAAQVGVYPEYVQAIADEGEHEAVERQLEAFEGSVIFPSATRTEHLARKEAVHEAWSAEFLWQLLESESPRRAHRIVADCVSAVLELADDQDRRDRIEWFYEGQRNRLNVIADSPTEWCDTLVEQLLTLGLKRPALAPLFGKSEYSRFSLPDACSETTRLRCSLWRGQMNQQASNFERARHEYEHLITAAEDASVEQSQQTSLQAEAYTHLGRTLSEEGDLSAAIDALEEAEQRYRELETPDGVADTLTERGYIEKTRGNLEAARDHIETARDLYQDVENDSGRAECLLELGIMDHRQGQPDSGYEQVETALEIYQRLNARDEEARCLNGLGTIAAQQGRFEEAKDHFQRSIEIAREVEDKHREANGLNNLARACGLEGSYEEAITYQEAAADIYEAIDDTNGLAACYHNLGEVAREQGDLDAAEEYLEDAGSIRQQANHTRRMYRSIHSLGVVELERGNYETAREHLREALEKFREFDEQRREAACLLRLGGLAMDTGDLTTSRQHTEDAVECCRAANAQDVMVDSLEQFVTICEKRGETQAAIEYCQEAVQVTEDAGMTQRREQLVDRRRQLEGTIEAD